MSLRSKLTRRWWQRMWRRFPRRRIQLLALKSAPSVTQRLERHHQLESLERRDLMVADPLSMHGTLWEYPDYMLSIDDSSPSSSETWIYEGPGMYAMPGTSDAPGDFPDDPAMDPVMENDFASWEAEAWWMMTTAGPMGPVTSSETPTTIDPGSLSGPGTTSEPSDPLATSHPTSGYPDSIFPSDTSSDSHHATWEVVDLQYERLAGGVGSSQLAGDFDSPALVGRVVRNSSSAHDSTLPDELDSLEAHHLAIEWEGEFPGEVAERTWVEPGGSFARTLDHLAYGQQTVRYRIVSWDFSTAASDSSLEFPREGDFEQNGKQLGAWQSFSFLHWAAPAPEVTELRITDYGQLGETHDYHASVWTTDPFGIPLSVPQVGRMVEGWVQSPKGNPVAYAAVYLEIHGEEPFTARATADEEGRFRYLLSDLDQETITVKARSSRWDTSAQAEVHGPWTTTTQHFQNPIASDPALAESAMEPVPEGDSASSSDLDSQRLAFERLRLEINGSPATHQAFQWRLQQAQQQYHQAAHELTGQPDLGGAEIAHRQRLELVWTKYQQTLRELAEWLKAEQLDAHRVHHLQVAQAEQEYRDRVNNATNPDLSSATTMEEMMVLYHQYREQLEEQAQIDRADSLAEARRELLHRVAAAQREFTQQQAVAERTWTMAQATSERELMNVRADWTRWMQERQILASKSLRDSTAEAVLLAAQQQADYRLRQLQQLLTDHPSSDGMVELEIQQHLLHSELAAEMARVMRSVIQLDVANALAYVANQHGEMQIHSIAQLTYRTARAEADESLKRGLAEGKYLADIERAEAEFDYLRAAIPLQAAQQVHYTSARAEQLAELADQWETSKAEIRHRETHHRVARHEAWSQIDLQSYIDYRSVVHRIEQSRTASLSEQQARADKERAELDASYFQAFAAARAQQTRAQSLAMTSQRVAQAESEARAVGDLISSELDALSRTRIEMEAARLVQRVASEAAAIDQAVSQQVQHELAWAAELAAAHRASTQKSSTATHAYTVAMSLSQLAHADQQVNIESAYRGATRAAHWNHQRAVADIELQEARGEITAEQAAERLADAARAKRQQEADAFVGRTNALAMVDLQFTQQAVDANNQRTQKLTSAARTQAQTTHDAEHRLSESNLTTWRRAADILDHVTAEFDRQLLLGEFQWLIGTSTANRQRESEIHQALRQETHAALLAQTDVPLPVGGLFMNGGNASIPATSTSTSGPESPNLANGPIRLFPESTATLEEAGISSWQHAQWSELEQVLADLAQHDDQWLENIASIRQSGLTASRASQIEYLNRLTDAVTSRATSQRSNQADWQIRIWNANSEFHQQTLLANGKVTRETTAANGEYQIAVATARANWLSIMAPAVAQLHVAGESPPMETSPSSTPSDAQQQYRAVIQQAEQVRQTQLRSARIQRAERIGEAWVDRARQVGAAGVELAEENGRASLMFAQVNRALETTYAIAMSEAERRLVEAMAATVAHGDVALARAIAGLHQAVSEAQQESLQRLITAKRNLLGELAEVEGVTWLASGFGPESLIADGSREDEFRQSARTLLPYQLALVTIDDRYVLDVARARTQRVVDLGQIDIGFAEASGTIRKAFARDASSAVRQFQMSLLNADQLLLTQAAYHDQTRARDRAVSEAQYELDAAVAAKQYLVGIAGLTESAGADSVFREWELAMANANASHAIRQARLEHRWTSDMISAEEIHTRFVLAAQFSLERTLVGTRQAMHGELATAAANRNRARGAVEARWLNQMADLGADWQRSVAYAQVELRAVEWSEGMRLEQLLGLGPTSGNHEVLVRATGEVLHAWQSEAWELYRDWIDQRGVIQRVGFQLWAAALENTIDGLAAADRNHAQSYLDAEASRRLAEIQAWDLYSQYMVSPARQIDQALADAERDFTIAQAEAERQRIITGDVMAGQAILTAALMDRQGQIDVARQNYLQAELVAASSRDQQWLAAADNFANAVVSSSNLWRQARNETILQWNDQSTQIQTARLGSLQKKDEQYAGLLASFWKNHMGDNEGRLPEVPRHVMLDLPGIWGELHGGEMLRSPHALDWSEWNLVGMGEESGISPQPLAMGLGMGWTEPMGSVPGSFAHVPVPTHLSNAMANDDLLRTGDATQILESIHPTTYRPGPFVEPGMPDPAHWAQFGGLDFQPGEEEGVSSAGMLLGGMVPASESHHSPYAIHGVGFRPGDGASSSPILGAHAPNLSRVDQSGWGGFFRDLSLMTQHPLATLKGAASGLVTSGKVLVNGTLTTLKSTATLGIASSPVEVLQVTEVDRTNGYDTSFAIMRTSQELLVGVTTGKLAAVKYPGRLGQIATGAYYWDAAQNATSTVRGGYGVTFGEGWTFENSVNLAGGMVGLSGNVIGRVSPTQRAPQSYSPEVLAQPQIGLGVNLDGKMDPIGHAFITFDRPFGQTVAHGFYPLEGFDLINPEHLQRLLGHQGGLLAAVIREKPEVFQSAGTLIQRYRVTEAQFQQARRLVEQIQEEARTGLVRYHAASQCATFARQVLKEAGVKTFIPVPYPPLMYATLWLKRTLG